MYKVYRYFITLILFSPQEPCKAFQEIWMKKLTRLEGRGDLNIWYVKKSYVNLLQCKKKERKNEKKGDKMRERIEEKRREEDGERREGEQSGEDRERKKEENEKRREENCQLS